MNISDMLNDAALHFPDRLAVVEDDMSVTFSEFDADTNRMASALTRTGVQPGDHVALCAPNSYAWLVVYFGAMKAGAVAVTFSYLLKQDELEKILDDCRPKVLFTVDEKLGELGNLSHRP